MRWRMHVLTSKTFCHTDSLSLREIVNSFRKVKYPMQILHVYRTYFPDPPGGLQEAIRQICISTYGEGVRNTIFALSTQPFPKLINYPEASVVRARSWVSPASCDIGGPNAFKNLRDLARDADVVHYHFPWPFADVIHNCMGLHKPAVMTYHSDIVRQRLLLTFYRPLMHRMLQQMAAIVATSPSYASMSEVLSDARFANRVRVIPLGIVESSYPAEGDDSVFTRLGLSKDEPYFLFVGVLRYYKGLHILVRAARHVGARIVIAGSGPEGAALKRLKQEQLASNVLFAGQVTNLEKVALIKRCRSLVLPSHLRSEAFGMTLVEAAMFGRPMVSCEIGTGTSYVNVHEESGLVVPPEDTNALAAALRTLLADDGLSIKLGQGARARYERLFSGPALGRAYSDLYREVLGV